MSDNLELRRKALEATGWKVGKGCCMGTSAKPFLGFHHPECKCPDDDTLDEYCRCFSGDYNECPSPCSHEDIHYECSREGPAVESDSGISEPWFLEWCEKNGFGFQLTYDPDTEPTEPFYCMLLNADMDETYVIGATPSEARCRAVIAAAKKGQT